MDKIKRTLSYMVKAAMKAKQMQKHYVRLNLDDDPPFQILGDILEGIYSLIGEHTDDFERSVTFIIMNAPMLTEERRVEVLYGEYQKNSTESVQQPKPHTFSREDMWKCFKENGGYMHETPEGSWS